MWALRQSKPDRARRPDWFIIRPLSYCLEAPVMLSNALSARATPSFVSMCVLLVGITGRYQRHRGHRPWNDRDPRGCLTFENTFDAALQTLVFDQQGCSADACRGAAMSGNLDLRVGSSYAGLTTENEMFVLSAHISLAVRERCSDRWRLTIARRSRSPELEPFFQERPRPEGVANAAFESATRPP